jgi:hypothetical protein
MLFLGAGYQGLSMVRNARGRFGYFNYYTYSPTFQFSWLNTACAPGRQGRAEFNRSAHSAGPYLWGCVSNDCLDVALGGMKEAARDGEGGRQVLEISFHGCLAFYEDMLAASLFASFLPSFLICLFAVLFASLFPGFFASVVALVLGVLFAAFEALEGDIETKMGSSGTEMEGSGTTNVPKWSPWGVKKGAREANLLFKGC